jgi:hypothetical protein
MGRECSLSWVGYRNKGKSTVRTVVDKTFREKTTRIKNPNTLTYNGTRNCTERRVDGSFVFGAYREFIPHPAAFLNPVLCKVECRVTFR